MGKKYYIAGPMSGMANLNFPAFYEVDAMLKALGYMTVNPAALDEAGLPEGVPDDELGMGLPINKGKFLVRDFRELAWCDGIVLLPGWEHSTGANCELAMARAMGIEVHEAYYEVYAVIDGILEWEISFHSLALPDYGMIEAYHKELMWATEQRRIENVQQSA